MHSVQTARIPKFDSRIDQEAGHSFGSAGSKKTLMGSPDDMGVVKVQPAKPKLKKPRMYHVVLLNDDYTPMDFVVVILQELFGMNYELAVRIMVQVHNSGRGVCGTFTREVAEMKVSEVLKRARRFQHPLQCEMVPA